MGIELALQLIVFLPLLAAIIAHFLVDFVPNVLFPLLGASD